MMRYYLNSDLPRSGTQIGILKTSESEFHL